jgi:cobalt/nickel transport system permease protein
MKTISLDRYIARESSIHAADARIKFVLVVGFILSLSLLPIGSFAALAIGWLALVLLSSIARLGPFRLTRGSFFAAPFLLAALPLIFTRQGDPLGDVNFGLFTLTASGEGLRMFATIALKSWVSVQAALLLTFTTPFPELVEALRRLHLPALMVAIIGFMYRYLAVMTDEATRMMRARAARSADPLGTGGGSLFWRAKVVGSMVGSLFLRAFERSERVYAAMQSRGFTGEMRYMTGRSLYTSEWLALGAFTAAIVAFEVAAHVWLPSS